MAQKGSLGEGVPLGVIAQLRKTSLIDGHLNMGKFSSNIRAWKKAHPDVVARGSAPRAKAKPRRTTPGGPGPGTGGRGSIGGRKPGERIGRPVGRGARLRPKATLRSRSARRATTTHKPKPENRRSIWPGTTGGAQRIRPSKPPPKRVGPARTRAGTTSRRTTRSRR